MNWRTPLLIFACALNAGCSSDEDEGPTSGPATVDLSPLGGDRPVEPHVPESYRHDIAAPLIIVLHGYGASGFFQSMLFRMAALSEAYGFVYLAPDGTPDEESKRFWSASDTCCDFYGVGVDDASYLRGLIEEAKLRFNIDARRVYLVGHSNGGFMSYRMACEHADQIAAVVSLAGAMFMDGTPCNPARPVAVLQIHGTADETVLYDGGDDLVGWPRTYPGARQTVEWWADVNGCDGTPDESAAPLDLVPENPGAETRVSKYATGCKPGGHAELWTMEGEPHVPDIGDEFGQAVVEFLFAHKAPG